MSGYGTGSYGSGTYGDASGGTPAIPPDTKSPLGGVFGKGTGGLLTGPRGGTPESRS